MKIVIELPSKNEALITVITMALFLLLTGVFIGLRSEHFLMVALYLVLFFAGLPTRKLALALLPLPFSESPTTGCVSVPITK